MTMIGRLQFHHDQDRAMIEHLIAVAESDLAKVKEVWEAAGAAYRHQRSHVAALKRRQAKLIPKAGHDGP